MVDRRTQHLASGIEVVRPIGHLDIVNERRKKDASLVKSCVNRQIVLQIVTPDYSAAKSFPFSSTGSFPLLLGLSLCPHFW